VCQEGKKSHVGRVAGEGATKQGEAVIQFPPWKCGIAGGMKSCRPVAERFIWRGGNAAGDGAVLGVQRCVWGRVLLEIRRLIG